MRGHVPGKEVKCLCRGISEHFARSVRPDQVAGIYSGVRLLCDSSASKTQTAFHAYVLTLDGPDRQTVQLAIFGKTNLYCRPLPSLPDEPERRPCAVQPPGERVRRGAWSVVQPLPIYGQADAAASHPRHLRPEPAGRRRLERGGTKPTSDRLLLDGRDVTGVPVRRSRPVVAGNDLMATLALGGVHTEAGRPMRPDTRPAGSRSPGSAGHQQRHHLHRFVGVRAGTGSGCQRAGRVRAGLPATRLGRAWPQGDLAHLVA